MSRDPERNAQQLAKLERLWHHLADNPFYQRKLEGCTGPDSGTGDFAWFTRLPFTTKQDLARDRTDHPPYGSNFSLPRERYSRFCQSSGTTAGPIPVLDTAESWAAMLDVWDTVYEEAGVTPDQAIFFAFSFGPFLGFWTAFEAATRRGNLSIPGGGLSSSARLQMLATYQPGVFCCTPTYAIRLGELLRASTPAVRDRVAIHTILVAGEPGGSIPATRERIAALWSGAQVRDHHGMTEVGPVTFESRRNPGSLLVEESAFYAEILDPESDREVEEGKEGELVLTPLDRIDKPLVRYRTGDLVRKSYWEDTLSLEGGILGRIDDMILVRGVNVYPAAVEQIIREFEDVAEFQVRVSERDAMTELEISVELSPGVADPDNVVRRIEVALSDAFALRFPVKAVPPDTLPRHEFKSKRWISS